MGPLLLLGLPAVGFGLPGASDVAQPWVPAIALCMSPVMAFRDLPQRHTTSVVNGAYAIANPPYSLCGLGDLLRSSMLHCAHVEIKQTLALIALFLVLLSQFDDLFEDLHVKPFAFGLRKHFLLLFVQLLQLNVNIFDPFDERANLAAGDSGSAKMTAKK